MEGKDFTFSCENIRNGLCRFDNKICLGLTETECIEWLIFKNYISPLPIVLDIP